ncbi:hypothetical protein KI387_019231, partial [Taxus chinensis]
MCTKISSEVSEDGFWGFSGHLRKRIIGLPDQIHGSHLGPAWQLIEGPSFIYRPLFQAWRLGSWGHLGKISKGAPDQIRSSHLRWAWQHIEGTSIIFLTPFQARRLGGGSVFEIREAGVMACSHQNKSLVKPRCLASLDDIICMFVWCSENLAMLRRQYGLCMNAKEEDMVVIKAYRALRDRIPYPILLILDRPWAVLDRHKNYCLGGACYRDWLPEDSPRLNTTQFKSLSILSSPSGVISPYLTIPPGLSSTTLPVSLVLLSNFKSDESCVGCIQGSGFKSLPAYKSGFFSAAIKLQDDYTVGVIVALYLSNNQQNLGHHDEIDMEFLRTIPGKPYTLQTNIYINGSGDGKVLTGRELKFHSLDRFSYHFFHLLMLVVKLLFMWRFDLQFICATYGLKEHYWDLCKDSINM